MESIYYVMSWLCHRSCKHCYEDRFRPYKGAELDRVVAEASKNYPEIIASFPSRLTYLDRNDVDEMGNPREKIGRIILAGGEVLIPPIREAVLYPALDLLREKYGSQGGVKIVIQTTGEHLTPKVLDELLKRGVWMITISGMDAYHKGLETIEERNLLQKSLQTLLDSRRLKPFREGIDSWGCAVDSGPWYLFFGATPGSWIGKLWPRGRALKNELTMATMDDNFCNAWSGGLNFLVSEHNGSEVTIDPTGDVYPCCLKTKRSIGNVTTTALDDILKSVKGNPIYEAISSGHPERMGLTRGWSEEKFIEQSTVRLPSGKTYRNLCFGCDRFHEAIVAREQG